MFIYFWETEHELGRGRQRGRQRIRSRLCADRLRPKQAQTQELWDHDLSWSQKLHQLSHLGSSQWLLLNFVALPCCLSLLKNILFSFRSPVNGIAYCLCFCLFVCFAHLMCLVIHECQIWKVFQKSKPQFLIRKRWGKLPLTISLDWYVNQVRW